MTNFDRDLKKQVEKLYRVTVYFLWLFVVLSWIVFGSFGIWGLRKEIELWQEHFTWTAVRYGIAYNRLPSISLAFCIGITVAVLILQSRHILWGMSVQERRRLEQQVRKIRQDGPKNPLWKWICPCDRH